MVSLLKNKLNFSEAQELIDAGADVNERDEKGNTPIFYAYDSKTLRLLITEGADVHTTGNNGRNVLFYQNEPRMVRLLLLHGIDVN